MSRVTVEAAGEAVTIDYDVTPARRGMLVGTSGGTSGSFNHAALVAAAGRQMGVRRSYWSATQVASMVSQAKADVARGSLPWVTLRFPGPWADVAAGKHDAWLADVRDRLAALDVEVWVGFHHEPENDEGATVTAHANWREAQRRAATVFAASSSKVKFWLVTTGYSQDHPANGTGWDTLWPDGAKIDGVAYDIYNWYGQAGKTSWSELPRQMDSLVALAKAKGCEWAIAETGLTDAAFSDVKNDGAGWLGRAMTSAAERGCAAFAYFDYTNSGVTWPLIPGAKRDQFVAALKASPEPY